MKILFIIRELAPQEPEPEGAPEVPMQEAPGQKEVPGQEVDMGPQPGQELVLANPSKYDHMNEASISLRGQEILAQLPPKKCKGKEKPFCCFYMNGWGPPGKLKRSVGFKSPHTLAHALAEWEAQGGPDIKHRIKMD